MSFLLYRKEEFNPNFYYCSGVDIDHSFFLKTRTKKLLLVPEMNKDYAESLSKIEVVSYGKKPIATLLSFICLVVSA